jgi:hypothetical protein
MGNNGCSLWKIGQRIKTLSVGKMRTYLMFMNWNKRLVSPQWSLQNLFSARLKNIHRSPRRRIEESTVQAIYYNLHAHTYTKIHTHSHIHSYTYTRTIYTYTRTVYTYAHLHLRTHVYTYIYTDKHKHAHIHIHARTYIQAHTQKQAHTRVHIHTHTHAHIYAYTRTHIGAYTYAYAHTHTYTHIHADTYINKNTWIPTQAQAYTRTLSHLHKQMHERVLSHSQMNTNIFTHARTHARTHIHAHTRTHTHTNKHQVLIRISRIEGWMTLLQESITEIYARLLHMSNLGRSLQLHAMYCTCPVISFVDWWKQHKSLGQLMPRSRFEKEWPDEKLARFNFERTAKAGNKSVNNPTPSSKCAQTRTWIFMKSVRILVRF